MFLNSLLEENAALADVALHLIGEGAILPDTYVLDLDMIRENASKIAAEANTYGLKSYFMLKQLGRNPLIGQRLAEIGLSGAVCVDCREALVLANARIPLGNVGHLVQMPRAVLGRVLAARPEIMTVYSIEKAREIGFEAVRQDFVQPIMLRVIGDDDLLYSGQYGGFRMSELEEIVDSLEDIRGIRIAGVCSFPCLLYSSESGEIEPLPNAKTVCDAADMLRGRGYQSLQVNLPSVSCSHAVSLVSSLGGTHMEPGHALTGTTPYHAAHPNAIERCGYVYVSEVSHCLDAHAFCYGGGYYRRGHLHEALVGTSLDDARRMRAFPPGDESIDYYIELSDSADVGEGVLMCFRSQMFVTRSEVVVASGISSGSPRIEGFFDTQGHRLK